MASGRRETGGVVDRGKHLTRTRGKPPGGGERERSGAVVFRPVLGVFLEAKVNQGQKLVAPYTVRNGQPG